MTRSASAMATRSWSGRDALSGVVGCLAGGDNLSKVNARRAVASNELAACASSSSLSNALSQLSIFVRSSSCIFRPFKWARSENCCVARLRLVPGRMSGRSRYRRAFCSAALTSAGQLGSLLPLRPSCELTRLTNRSWTAKLVLAEK